MAELADALDLGSSPVKGGGSTPPPRTKTLEIEINRPKEWLRELEITVEPEKVKERIEEYTRIYMRKAQIPGFRKGKAPKNIIEKRFSKSIISDACDSLIDETYKEAIESNGFKPLTPGRVEEMKLRDDKSLKFKVSFEIIPEFNLSPYKKIKVERREPKGLKEELERRLSHLQEKMATFISVSRPSKEGDFILMDYLPFENNRPKGKREKGVLVMVGDKLNFPEINRALLGVSPNTQKDVEVKFPDDYQDESLRGKRVIYRLWIRDVKERILPELNDAFAKSLNFNSLNELKKKLEEDIERESERLVLQDIKNQIYDYLLRSHSFQPPPSLIGLAYENLLSEYRAEDSEPTRKKLLPLAIRRVKLQLILDRIAEEEKIEVKEEEIDERIKEYARVFKMDPDRLKDNFYRLRRIESLKRDILREKVSDLLLKYAEVK